jgi:hypothetical protein
MRGLLMVAYRRRPRGFHLDKRAADILKADRGNADAVMTEAELAAWFDVSVGWVRYVRNYRNRSDGPPCVEVDGIAHYRRRDVREWLEHRRKYYAEKVAARLEFERKFKEGCKQERKAFNEAAARRSAQASKRSSGGGRDAREERKEKTAAL